MTLRLKNKIALITGASRGLGAAVAKRFAFEGAQLILVARSLADLEHVDDEVQKISSPALLVPFDLTDLPHLDTLAHSIAERFGRLDVLVGNATAFSNLTPLTHTPSSVWHHVITTNLHANWHLLKACEPLLIKSDAARLIFVTSDIAQKHTPYWGAYAVSKAALETMTKIYAAEVAHKGFKVNLIDPGSLRAEMDAQAGEELLSRSFPEDIMEAFVCLAESACKKNGELITPQVT